MAQKYPASYFIYQTSDATLATAVAAAQTQLTGLKSQLGFQLVGQVNILWNGTVYVVSFTYGIPS